ncbi:MAG: chemotaxis protein CheX [Planctomycetota bacterium]
MPSDINHAADLDALGLAPTLAEVMGLVFQSYGLEATPIEGAAPFGLGGAVAVIGFEGPRTGLVTLRLDGPGAEAMATSLLGGFPPESDAERNDALGEWANISAGNLKTKALDPLGDFRLGLPVVADREGPGSETPARLCYRLGELGSLEVALILDKAD